MYNKSLKKGARNNNKEQLKKKKKEEKGNWYSNMTILFILLNLAFVDGSNQK